MGNTTRADGIKIQYVISGPFPKGVKTKSAVVVFVFVVFVVVVMKNMTGRSKQFYGDDGDDDEGRLS